MRGRVIPFPRPGPEPADDREFAELLRVRDQAEALVVRSLFESHGIHVVLRTHVAPSVHPFTVGDQGEVRILVARPDLATGRLLLGRRSRGGRRIRTPLARRARDRAPRAR